MQWAMLGFQLLYIFEGKHLNKHNLIAKFKLWVIVLFIHHFSKKYWKKYTLNLFFIDNEKGIPHFKFARFDYGYSGVYLQKCIYK